MAENEEQRKESSNPGEESAPPPPSLDDLADLFAPDDSGQSPAESAESETEGEAQGDDAAPEPADPEAGGMSDEQLDAEEAFGEGFSEDELTAQATQAEEEDLPADLAKEPAEAEEAEPVTLEDLFPPAPSEEQDEEQAKPTPEEAVGPAAFAKQDAEKAGAEQASPGAGQVAGETLGAGDVQADPDSSAEQPAEDGADELPADVVAALTTGGEPGGLVPAGSAKLVYLLASMNILLLLLVAGVLAGVYLWTGGRTPRPAEAAPSPRAQALPAESVPDLTDADPSSWRLAEKAYVEGKTAEADARYKYLLGICRSQKDGELAADFCRFRAALCRVRLGRLAEGREQLEGVCTSRSPMIRASANLAVAELDCAQGAFLRGRMKAYQALAVLAAADGQESLRSDAEFLIARCLTEKVLSFAPSDSSVPWKRSPGPADAFVDLDAAALHAALAEGADAGAVLLGPRIEKAPSRPVASRWVVQCHRTGLEELLQQFASQSAADVQWVDVAADVRQRNVTLCLRSASAPSVFEIACGAAGLIGRFTGEKVLIHNPHTAASMGEQRELIAAEAVSAWRRFYLRFPSDRRSAQGHFALARLSELAGETLTALQEYLLIARRFPRDDVAPWSLLRGARLRIGLQDHRGAQADLSDLLNLYPDFAAIDHAHLDLGRATMQAGRLGEALNMFCKLYYLDLSRRSQALACLNAGRCLFELGRHEESCKWLARYVKLGGGAVGADMAEAYLLTGRCLATLGYAPEAAAAFRQGLRLQPDPSQRIELLLELADAEKQSRRFGQALAALAEAEKGKLPPAQYARHTLAVAGTFRAMGLPERALSALRRASPNVRDEAAAAEMSVEAARCHADSGERDAARKILVDVLPKLGSGPIAREASIELAQICLADGKAAQAVAICQNLLTPSLPPEQRKAVLTVLARAHQQQQDYERAAVALSGLAGDAKAPKKP